MPAVLELQSLTKQYKNLTALENANLTIEAGEIFALLGPNGAGKTTLIGCVCGLVKKTSGTVKVFGIDLDQDSVKPRFDVGLVPQEINFDPFFTVREALRIQSGYFGVRNNEAWIAELLESLGLAVKANANMRQLSGGMKRRVLVAQALVHKPPVIVLDEPTAGVDVELRQTLWQFIARLNREGHTVLLTTHYLEEAEALCNRIAMLKAGRVVALERTSDLLKAASSNVLRFKIDRDLPPQFADKARVTGRIVQLPAHDAHEIETYLATIRQAGLSVEDVEIRKPDLEDVFLDVMSAKHQQEIAA